MKKRKRNTKNPVPLMIGGGLLLITVAIMLASQNTSMVIPAPTAPIDENGADTGIPAPATHRDEEAADAAVPRISLVEAKAAHDSGSAVFLDVRSADAYQIDHIANAINIPLGELESRISELDPGQWIITYCT